MTYSVIWSFTAIGQFTRMAAATDDPKALDQAAAWVDYTLRRMPMDAGESRSDPRTRLWYGDVFGVYFRVDPDTMTVRIGSVGPARRRK